MLAWCFDLNEIAHALANRYQLFYVRLPIKSVIICNVKTLGLLCYETAVTRTHKS